MDMEPTPPENNENLFFHQQRNPVRQYRRVRKEPEELPQALRYFKYANLNPRIAAFLGKQDPKSLLKRAKNQGGKQDAKEGTSISPSGAAALMGGLGGEYGNDLSKEARSLLPDIGQGYGKMAAFGDENFGQSRMSFNNEAEDPQRYQFEETTFAAPNILRELADTLSRFSSSFKEYANRTTMYDPETGDPLATEATSPAILLPPGISKLLCQDWSDVTSEAVYTPRNWQSSAYQAGYRYATTLASGKRDSPIPLVNTIPKVSGGPVDKGGATNASGGLKSIVDLLEEVRTKSHSKREGDNADARTIYEYKKKGKSASKDATQTSTGIPAADSSSKDDDSARKSAITKHQSRTAQDEVRAKITNKTPKSVVSKQTSKVFLSKQTSKAAFRGASKQLTLGANKLQGIPEERTGGTLNKPKDWSLKSNMSVTGVQEGVERLPRHGGVPTLSFNLSSKKALEEGWIVAAQPEPDMEQTNLLEWATGRLQSAIKQREEEEENAKSRGANKPMMLRYYGDSRRDTLLKLYRKGNEADGKAGAVAAGLLPGKKSGGVPKIPQLTKFDNGQRDRFMVQLPDGSISVYYPKNGKVAIMASAVPDAADQLYVHCYANDDDRMCLATFTPYGKSCCYHKNGVPGLILSDLGGLLKSENGSVSKKWEWPKDGAKTKEHIVFQLNKEMYVRVINKHNVSLHFSSNRETVKIPVGAVSGVAQPQSTTSEHLGVLQSGYKLSSKAASDFQNIPKQFTKDEKSKTAKTRRSYGFRKQSKKPFELEELKHSLDPPGRFEFESQADRELMRLQDKTKHLVDEWLEHYRLAVGISSPALKKLIDKPQVKTAKRKIQSAKERKISYPDDDEFDDKGTKFQSFRSPSAPPKHMVPGPHSVVIKDNRTKPTPTPGTSKKQTESQHVRIDDTPVDGAAEPISGKERSSSHQLTSSTSSRIRPATLGSRGLQRSRRSLLRTNSANASPPSRDKPWTPTSECCPVVTRCKLTHQDKKFGEKSLACKCNKHRIPSINDLEFDYFIRMVAPVTQLIVICVVNSLYPDASPYDAMFDRLYIEKNKNRTNTCRQSRHDQYRVLRYDLAVAKIGTNLSTPLLLGRHNAVPGMTLMYCSGHLIFADHIFNGYGNARNDFRKQVFKSRQEYMMGRFLPDDFRFTPGRGRPGARAAWGGEMGGAGVDGKGRPGMFFSNEVTTPIPGNKSKSAGIRVTTPGKLGFSHSTSDVTSASSYPVKMTTSKSFDTSRDFVQYSLSTRMYVLPHVKPSSNTIHHSHETRHAAINSTFPPTTATSHSPLDSDGSLRVGQLNSFVRMQAVK